MVAPLGRGGQAPPHILFAQSAEKLTFPPLPIGNEDNSTHRDQDTARLPCQRVVLTAMPGRRAARLRRAAGAADDGRRLSPRPTLASGCRNTISGHMLNLETRVTVRPRVQRPGDDDQREYRGRPPAARTLHAVPCA